MLTVYRNRRIQVVCVGKYQQYTLLGARAFISADAK